MSRYTVDRVNPSNLLGGAGFKLIKIQFIGGVNWRFGASGSLQWTHGIVLSMTAAI